MSSSQREQRPDDDPLWYKDAIIYQLHVKAFFDSDSDGVGDFAGLRAKLDYLQALGVTAIWLLPFYPSPLKDDGYDIADYSGVHPTYGTLADFREFLNEAHRRGLRVITELVINHTSDQHAWFQRAKKAPPGSREREFYVWSDDPSKYADARIIFKDFEQSNWAWDHQAQAYYWHRFYSHQPDLNFDNPEVRQAVAHLMDEWLDMGVDGMRLDAIPYLIEREGTSCENLPETHEVLKELRAHMDARFADRMFLAEANQWPEDAAQYFGQGDECQMNFHFPLMPRLWMAVRMEDRFPIIDILKQTPEIPANCQWAIFLRNHDELTLEMVTDEERDYMYRVYAQDTRARINLGIRRRLAPLLESNRRKIELMNGLLLSLPGTPVIYYGDEIGMGDNIYLGDRNGVRTPMQWSSDRNAGFSRCNPQRLYLPVIVDPEYHYESVNVEAHENNPSSLLWWMRRLISLRKKYRAFGRGTIRFLSPANRKVLAYVREYEGERVMVVVNLSRFAQYVELDLADFEGMVPVELFGQTEFPMVARRPYILTLGPHAFHWFALEPEQARRHPTAVDTEALRTLRIPVPGDDWTGIFEGKARQRLEAILPGYMRAQRWFRGKARAARDATITDVVPLDGGAQLVFVQVSFIEGDSDLYVLPLGYAPPADAELLFENNPQAVIVQLELGETKPGVLFDAVGDAGVARAFLQTVIGKRSPRGERGKITGVANQRAKLLEPPQVDGTRASVLRAEQSNTSISYDDRWLLKLFRRVEDGVSLDLELGRYLTEHDFPHAAAVLGALEYSTDKGVPRTVAVLNEFVENEGDAWKYTLDELSGFVERALASPSPAPEVDTSTRGVLRLAEAVPPPETGELIGSYLESARLLGCRTAELHRTLANPDHPDFAPEPFNTFYRRSLYQSMRNLTGKVLQEVSASRGSLPPDVAVTLEHIASSEEQLLSRFRRIVDERAEATRIRTHGDYHLGQVLFTGKDFVITDFEGEPARPLSERRLKRSPLRDVAGMLRSFHYAAFTARIDAERSGVLQSAAAEQLEPWVRFWYAWVAAVFLREYVACGHGEIFVPRNPRHVEVLLDAYLLEKVVYEIGYELNNRPAWIVVPVHALSEMLGIDTRVGT
ncbi:MAG: maltose alpha-D-glucosyltransferase [Longimicrobiales bacterium]